MFFSIFKVVFIIYTVIALVGSFIGFYFMDEYSSQKIKNTIIVMSVIWLILLFVLMEIQ